MAASRLREARQMCDGRAGKGEFQSSELVRCAPGPSLRWRLRRHLTVRHILTPWVPHGVTRLLDARASLRGRCTAPNNNNNIIIITRGCRERKASVFFSWGRGPKKRTRKFP